MALAGKRIIITGGAGVLGQGVASVAEQQGAEVFLLDVAAARSDLIGELHQVDLTDSASLTACLDAIGDFDVLANIAGGFDMGATVFATEDESWDAMFTINVTTLRRVLEVAVPRLLARGRGSIINVGALGALKGAANMGAYLASKSVVMRLTESLSEEVKAAGVNVNAVLPTIINTPRNRADMPDADAAAWVDPQDLAAVICFLGSDAAKAVHGALVPVTGLS
ncbi:MAG: SDR family oxidoreductase [Proteobacteria bacterium]|nr:SDR family oxidoreductase [Pseudomonadota bacterium]